MHIRDLDYFAAIVRHGSLARAADVLDLTPAALSKSLRRLEETLSARLMERGPKGLRLTSAGRVLAERAEKLRLSFEDVKHEAAEMSTGRAGRVRIGVTPVDSERITRECMSLLADGSALEFEIVVATSNDDMVPRLRAGELDLVVTLTSRRYADLVHQTLCRDAFVVNSAPDHPLARRRRLTPEHLVEERWALDVGTQRPRQALEQAFLGRGLPLPRVAVESSSVEVRLLAVARSSCLGYHSRRFLRRASADMRTVVLPVEGLEWPVSLDVLHRKDAWLSRAVSRVLDRLRSGVRWEA